jgi:predicted nucleotidyltransferase
VDLHEKLRAAAVGLPSIKLLALFGPAARGELRQGSDVDLLVDLEPDTLEERIRVEAALGRAADREVDIIHAHGAPPLLRFEIARDGVVLHEMAEGAWTHFKAMAMLDWWDYRPTAEIYQRAALARLAASAAGVED